MTEQETRNKINKIIFDVLHRKCVGDDCDKCVYKMNYGKKYCAIDRICDALIAAEIGDVGELRHRAEVAEKALYNACRISAAIPTKEFVSARVDCFLKQAEKELQTERRGGSMPTHWCISWSGTVELGFDDGTYLPRRAAVLLYPEYFDEKNNPILSMLPMDKGDVQ